MQKTSFILIIIAIILSSCKDPFWLEDNKVKNDKDRSLEFRVIFNSNHQYSYEFNDRKTIVIKSQSELNDFLKTMQSTIFPDPGFPVVDFDKKMLFGIVFPAQSSGSNKLSITDINMNDRIIEVSSELNIPDIGTDDIGYPVVFVELDIFDNDVKFLETKIIRNNSSILDFYGISFELTKVVDEDGNVIDPNNYRAADSQWQRLDLDPFTIEFNEDGALFGQSNCNSYGAKFEISGTNIKIEELWSTEAACALSGLYQLLLTKSVAFKYSSNELELHSLDNSKKYTLYFKNKDYENIKLLQNSNWTLEMYSEDGGITLYNGYYNENNDYIGFDYEEYSLKFNNGQLSGLANCTEFSTNYTIANKSNIIINEIIVNQECGYNKKYIYNLNESYSFEIIDSPNLKLKLYNIEKNIVMIFKQRVPVVTNEYELYDNETYFLEAYGHYYDEYRVEYKGSFSNQTIVFNDNIIEGEIECNTYSGNYELLQPNGKINFNLKLNTDDDCQSQYLPNFKYDYINCFNKATKYFTRENGRFFYIYFESVDPNEINYLMFYRNQN